MTTSDVACQTKEQSIDDLKNLSQDILKKAKALGASQVEVGLSIDTGFEVTVRLGAVETISYQRDRGVGITVYFGQRKGYASTSDTNPKSIQETIQAACDIARFTNEDAFAGLPEKTLLAFEYPDLDLSHPWDLTPQEASDLALSCETYGRESNPLVSNSEGVTISTFASKQVLANSHGFIGGYPTTHHSISCVLLAQKGEEMQRDYDYSSARDFKQLASIEEIASSAAKRCVQRLGARKIKTGKYPVIFEAPVAKGLLGTFISAISGGRLYRKASFLLDALHQQVFAKHITLTEVPHLLSAPGSAPYDSEGVKNTKHAIVTQGRLDSYILSSYSARKLSMQTTGNAGGVRNLHVTHSDKNLAQLLKAMDTGLLVTSLMGQGVNIVTGDYSRGISGFWVENGEIQFPINEMTIASNLKDMYQNIIAVGNDLDTRGNIVTGSIWIGEMMVAGD